MDNQEENKVMAIIGAIGGIGSTLAGSLIDAGHTVALGVQNAVCGPANIIRKSSIN